MNYLHHLRTSANARFDSFIRMFGSPVVRGTGSRRSIALTFDDGPSPGTLPLLEILAREKLRCTFFQCAANVLRHPQIARAVRDAGHEIANHTYSHKRLAPRLSWRPNLLSAETVMREFADAQQVFRSELGLTPSLMRLPYGLPWFGIDAVQRELSLTNILWTVIGNDWELPAEAIVGRVLSCASPGAIVCLHDGRDLQPFPNVDSTLLAVSLLVPRLKSEGFCFEVVSDLLQPDR